MATTKKQGTLAKVPCVCNFSAIATAKSRKQGTLAKVHPDCMNASTKMNKKQPQTNRPNENKQEKSLTVA